MHADGVGARIVGKYMYLTTERDLTIYDISKPAAPERLGHMPFVLRTFNALALVGTVFSRYPSFASPA